MWPVSHQIFNNCPNNTNKLQYFTISEEDDKIYQEEINTACQPTSPTTSSYSMKSFLYGLNDSFCDWTTSPTFIHEESPNGLCEILTIEYNPTSAPTMVNSPILPNEETLEIPNQVNEAHESLPDLTETDSKVADFILQEESLEELVKIGKGRSPISQDPLWPACATHQPVLQTCEEGDLAATFDCLHDMCVNQPELTLEMLRKKDLRLFSYIRSLHSGKRANSTPSVGGSSPATYQFSLDNKPTDECQQQTRISSPISSDSSVKSDVDCGIPHKKKRKSIDSMPDSATPTSKPKKFKQYNPHQTKVTNTYQGPTNTRPSYPGQEKHLKNFSSKNGEMIAKSIQPHVKPKEYDHLVTKFKISK